jgi:hypothetical protein
VEEQQAAKERDRIAQARYRDKYASLFVFRPNN